MATRTISAAGGTWTSTAAWLEGVVPTTSDYIIGNSSSGALTLGASRTVQGYDLSQYTSTLTMANFNLIGNANGFTAAFGTSFSVSKTYGQTGFQVANTTGTMSVVCNGRNVEFIQFGGDGSKNLIDNLFTQYFNNVSVNWQNAGSGTILVLNGTVSSLSLNCKTLISITGSHCTIAASADFSNLEINCDTVNLPGSFRVVSSTGYTASYTWIKGTFSTFAGSGNIRFSGVAGQNVFINSWKPTISGTVSFEGAANFSYVLNTNINCGTLAITNTTPNFTASSTYSINVYDFANITAGPVPVYSPAQITLTGITTSSYLNYRNPNALPSRFIIDTPGIVDLDAGILRSVPSSTFDTYFEYKSGKFRIISIDNSFATIKSDIPFGSKRAKYKFGGATFSTFIAYPDNTNEIEFLDTLNLSNNFIFQPRANSQTQLTVFGEFNADNLWITPYFSLATNNVFIGSYGQPNLRLESGKTYTVRNIIGNDPFYTAFNNNKSILQSNTASSPAYINFTGTKMNLGYINITDINNTGNTIYAVEATKSDVTLLRTSGFTLLSSSGGGTGSGPSTSAFTFLT